MSGSLRHLPDIIPERVSAVWGFEMDDQTKAVLKATVVMLAGYVVLLFAVISVFCTLFE